MKKFIAPVLFASLLIGALTPAAQAQLRVVNYNVAQLNGNQAALQAVFAALNSDDKPGFAVAPHVYAFQEMGSSDPGPLLTMLNAVAPPGVTYALGTFTINTPPNTSESSSAGAQAMYYRSDMLVEEVAGHVDISTGAGRNADRWKLKLIGYDSPAASFYIYSCHLKASNTSSDAAQRLSGATAIRTNADALPAGTHIIYTGDWNVYSNLESAYLKFLSVGSGQSFDPLGTGSWAARAMRSSTPKRPAAMVAHSSPAEWMTDSITSTSPPPSTMARDCQSFPGRTAHLAMTATITTRTSTRVTTPITRWTSLDRTRWPQI